jgi:hypothetical protein
MKDRRTIEAWGPLMRLLKRGKLVMSDVAGCSFRWQTVNMDHDTKVQSFRTRYELEKAGVPESDMPDL